MQKTATPTTPRVLATGWRGGAVVGGEEEDVRARTRVPLSVPTSECNVHACFWDRASKFSLKAHPREWASATVVECACVTVVECVCVTVVEFARVTAYLSYV